MGWARKLSGTPTVTVSWLTLKLDLVEIFGARGSDAANNLPQLREMMARGDFDVVAIGRALIANPTWPQKVRSGAQMVPFEATALAKLN